MTENRDDPPTGLVAGMGWTNTATGEDFVYDGSAWIRSVPPNTTDPIPSDYASQTKEQAMAHLTEELLEAATAAAKSLRFGFYSVNPELPPAQQESNFFWLRREMADVARAYFVLGELVDGPDFARELMTDLTVQFKVSP